MLGILSGKVAIITGSNGGIGAAYAQGFLREGAKVVLTEHDRKGAEDIARATGLSEENWMVHYLDAADRESVHTLIVDTVERFGKIDILVAHAGGNSRRGFFFELTDDDFDHVIKNNCKSTFMCCQEAAREMAKTGGGSIIVTSSLNTKLGHPNSVIYGASKGCVQTMALCMASDLLKYNIRVNTIIPGTIYSNQTKARLDDPEYLAKELNTQPMRKIGYPEDLIGAAVYLASDASSYVTASEIVVDGGKSGYAPKDKVENGSS